MVERQRSGGGIKDRIKRMVIDDEGIDTKMVLERLARDLKGGSHVEMPSKMLVDSVCTDTRQTIRLMREMGRMKAPRAR